MTFDVGDPDPSFGPAGRPYPRFFRGTTRDAAQFRRRIEGFKGHIAGKAHHLYKRVLAEALTGLVLANPVGNPSTWKKPRKGYVGGHSRRNWQITVKGPNVVPKPGVDQNGTQAMAEGYLKIANIKPNERRAWLVNPIDYMEQLNRGWSPQAPVGWIDQTFQRVLAKYRRVK